MSASASAIQAQDQKFSDLGLTKTIVNAEQVCTYSRGLGSVTENNPVTVLIHGYPQSSYLWRHFIALLPSKAPLFVPDLPGYGASAPIKDNDKLSIGNTILAALETQVKRSSSTTTTAPIPVILVGHDRGARVVHRLAVAGYEGVDIKGVCLVDIVPTSTQWAASSNPREIVGYWHWPFLANVTQAKAMITSYGGDRWARDMITSWSGHNERGLASLKSDNALDIYGGFFKEEHVIEASNRDYEAGATIDVEMQNDDQKEGRKIKQPLFLLYSGEYIGKRYDVPAEWREWVDQGVQVKNFAIGEGIGHFGVEEAPEVSVRVFGEWLGELGVVY